MGPIEFFETAEELARGRREADWRSSVSRAYYYVYHILNAAFHEAIPSRLLGNAGFPKQKNVTHKFLVDCLRGTEDEEVTDIGDMLKDFRASRDTADYKLQRKIDTRKAQDACAEAVDIIEELAFVTPERMASAIEPYLMKRNTP